jgi:5-methylcytosine-specific restriction protein A
MAVQLPRTCTVCGAVTAGGTRCADHPAKPRQKPRPPPNERGYDRRWKRARAAYIARNPLCECCSTAARPVPATVVDHIVPLHAGGARLDFGNLQSLCTRCHSSTKQRQENAARRGR